MTVSYWESPLGRMYLAASEGEITHLGFVGQRHMPAELFEAEAGDLGIFRQGISWLERYFAAQDPGMPPPLCPRGTPFQREVWELLLAIPYGQSVTYGDLAQAMAKRRGLERMSSQAVGQAVAHNPISLMIPCHRVLGAHGSLTGYAGGIERKRLLLCLEGTDLGRTGAYARSEDSVE